jgi:hypothetical protein
MSSSDVLDAGRVGSGVDLVGRAREATAVLAENAERTERALRPAPDSVAAVRA